MSHDYIWSGDRLLAEVTDDYILKFFYDASGNVLGFEYLTPTTDADGNTDYTGTTYYYEKNIFGDVVAIYDENGTKVGAYGFNSYGQNNVVTNLTDDNIASLNPIRYRSYYYDTDIYLYYLQSRYYDPVTCRFINADSYASTGQGLLGNNMFAYCLNNPIKYCDSKGNLAVEIIVGIIILGVVICSLTGCDNNSSVEQSTDEEGYPVIDTSKYCEGYPSEQEAVIAATIQMEKLYQEEIERSGRKYEFATNIFKFKGDDRYYFSVDYIYTEYDGRGITFINSYAPEGAVVVAHIHSHPLVDDIHFSGPDKSMMRKAPFKQYNFYLLEFDPITNQRAAIYYFRRYSSPQLQDELVWPT